MDSTPSLKELVLSNQWNEPLSELVLPASLRSLSFGSRFNQSVRGFTFPSLIEEIRFGANFNQSLSADNWSPPPLLNFLQLGSEWDLAAADLYLPPSLITFQSYSEFKALPISSLNSLLPVGLHRLDVSSAFSTLDELIRLGVPPSLHYLKVTIKRSSIRSNDDPHIDREIYVDSFESGYPHRHKLIEQIEVHLQMNPLANIQFIIRSTPPTTHTQIE